MSATKQVDPCVSLQIDPDGVLLTVSAQLQEGAMNWTPEEASEWFARTWQEAQSVLTVATLQRAQAAVEEGGRIIRQGDAAWKVSEGVAQEPQIDLEEIPDSESPKTSPEEESSSPTLIRIPEKIGETADQRKLIRVINRTGDAVTQSLLKKETSLSDYRIKKALVALLDKGVVRESKVETGGRWKETTAYSVLIGEG
jgi:hypothetical protein